VDEGDPGTQPRVLFYLEHAIQDAATTRSGERRVISKRMLYVEMDSQGNARHVQYAPYLDYRPLRTGEVELDALLARPDFTWIAKDLERQALTHAVQHVVPAHLAEVRGPKLALIDKTEAAVKDRLTKEIIYWDHRANELSLQERAGKSNARLNSNEARKRADGLQARLEGRLNELKLERQISPLPPVIIGGVLIVPAGLVAFLQEESASPSTDDHDNLAAAAAARQAVMEAERALGFEPVDRETDKLGYDIESRIPGTGQLRFIEVKGRISGASTITVTRNEILYSLNKPDDYILAVVEFDGPDQQIHYVRRPFQREPDFGVTSVNYDFAELLTRAASPS
jgi:hypothetical protein